MKEIMAHIPQSSYVFFSLCDCLSSLDESHSCICTLTSGENESVLQAGASGPSSVLSSLLLRGHVPHISHGPICIIPEGHSQACLAWLGEPALGGKGRGHRWGKDAAGVFFPCTQCSIWTNTCVASVFIINTGMK